MITAAVVAGPRARRAVARITAPDDHTQAVSP